MVCIHPWMYTMWTGGGPSITKQRVTTKQAFVAMLSTMPNAVWRATAPLQCKRPMWRESPYQMGMEGPTQAPKLPNTRYVLKR